MDIIVVDDERLALTGMAKMVRRVAPDARVTAFASGEEALDAARQEAPDVAFLDIQMRGMGGIALARELQALSPSVNIIFCTGYGEYAQEGHNLHASGYIMKPPAEERVRAELADLRHPVAGKSQKRLRVQAFGNFEIYWGDEPVVFHYTKTKELFAYLVDRRGALCTTAEMVNILWEGAAPSKKSSYFQNLRADLFGVLDKLGCGDVIIRKTGQMGINVDRIDCDYYDWLARKPASLNAFHGEYMQQYSWSEFTLGLLS